MRIIVFLLFCTFLMLSCQKPSTDGQLLLQDIVRLETRASVNEIVLQNKYIDLDTKSAVNPNNLSDVERAEAKAAIYRFYKRVRVEDGLYVTDLKTADEINISPGLFSLFKDNLEEMNAYIRQQQAKGEKVEIFQLNDAYFDHLLK